MTGPELRAALAGIGLTVAGFRRVIMALSGQEIAEATVYRWVWGDRRVPQTVAALVELLRRLPAQNRRALAAR